MPTAAQGTLAFLPPPGAWMGTILFMIFLVALPALMFSIPLLAIWTHHRRKMEELRLQRQSGLGKEIQAEFAAIREEIKSLRDTTLQYDLSFDTALQGLERRLANVERTNYLQNEDVPNQTSYVGR